MADLPSTFDALDSDRLRAPANAKWTAVEDDVLPLWVADMDFPIATPIRAALTAYADGDYFGYPPQNGLPGVRESCVRRLSSRYGWTVDVDDVILLSGIIPAMFTCVETFTSRGDEILLPTPLYPWFATSVERTERVATAVDLAQDDTGRYVLAADAMAEHITPATRMVMMCNPHNPTGRVFSRTELTAVADMALEHDLWIVSDELHADLAYGARHIPMASLSPEVAARTVTLYGPTKAFNIAGLNVGFAIAEDPTVLESLTEALYGPVAGPNVLAQTATMAAFDAGDDWLEHTLAYLQNNRALVADFVRDHLPGVRHLPPEATYLAWLDFRSTPIADAPAEFLREHARVALNEGVEYGAAGRGFARLNFATSRSIVSAALDRIAQALDAAR